MVHRIRADFNTMNVDEERRVDLPTHVQPDLLRFLQPGLRVIVFEPYDFEVDAVVEYDALHDAWLARPDWSTKRNLESVAYARFWDSVYKMQDAKAAGHAAEEAMLNSLVKDRWNALTKDERDYLRGLSRFADFEEPQT